MAGLIDKRKRSREDDICDSTPLSKRINQLHLTNFEEAQAQAHPVQPDTATHIAVAQLYNANSSYASIEHAALHNPSKHLMDMPAAVAQQHQQLYEPELNEEENPFYYIKNKLLHELHFERLKRCTV